ncbi:MAG: hypothetical protein QY319_05075 [Candidatus Kapaibacterium sp.]|nr:MAG: hypothetical protein QY319_05075 [Candidatus Kapabacteria bacterium]
MNNTSNKVGRDLDAEYLSRRAHHNSSIERLMGKVAKERPHLNSEGIKSEQRRRIREYREVWYEPMGSKKSRNDFLVLLPQEFALATSGYVSETRHSTFFEFDYPQYKSQYEDKIKGRVRQIVNGDVLKWTNEKIVDFLACMDACSHYMNQLLTIAPASSGEKKQTTSGKYSIADTQRYEARQALHAVLALLSSFGPPDQILSVNKSQLSRLLMSLTGISTDTYDNMIDLAIARLDYDGNNNLKRVLSELINLKLDGIRTDFLEEAIKRDPPE